MERKRGAGDRADHPRERRMAGRRSTGAKTQKAKTKPKSKKAGLPRQPHSSVRVRVTASEVSGVPWRAEARRVMNPLVR